MTFHFPALKLLQDKENTKLQLFLMAFRVYKAGHLRPSTAWCRWSLPSLPLLSEQLSFKAHELFSAPEVSGSSCLCVLQGHFPSRD